MDVGHAVSFKNRLQYKIGLAIRQLVAIQDQLEEAMRRLIVWNLMTLDGQFEGRSPWDLAFHEAVWGEELEALSLEHAEHADALLFGRTTYEGMAAHWAKATGRIADFMNGARKHVASSRPLDPPWTNSERLEGDIPEAVRKLKSAAGRDILVFGSAKLMAALLDAHLVDEMRLCIAPILLGQGTPLFKPRQRQIDLALLEARPLRNGAVILRYTPQG
jgi:dihydrofolate reductase